LDLLIKVGLTASRGEGRRLVQQGGLYIKEDRVDNIDLVVTGQDFSDGTLMLRKGKKVYHLVKLI
jgi:tyrosyl-tRNA synthetase